MRVLICAALIMIGLVCVAQAQTVYLGPQGQLLGQSYQSGNQTIYLGPQGQPLGSSYNSGSSCGSSDPFAGAYAPTPTENAFNGARAVDELIQSNIRTNALLRQQRRQQEGR